MRFYKIIVFFQVICFQLSSQNNIDFESTAAGSYTASNAVSGWTLSSRTMTGCNTPTAWTPGGPEFSIASTPLINFPNIGSVPNSPLGGNKVAILNNTISNSSSTKISYSFSVTNGNSLLQVAFAGYFQNGSHNCCEQAGLRIYLTDANGAIIVCQTTTLLAPGCTSPVTFTSNASGDIFTNWTSIYRDLTPYLSTNVTLHVESTDCDCGAHLGYLLFDAKLDWQVWNCLCPGPPSNILNYDHCPGSALAKLYAPLGYISYSWTAPAGSPISPSQATLSVLSITNAILGNTYTVNMTLPSGCQYVHTITIGNSSVNVVGIGSTSSCIGGSSGSATVVAAGSASGYTYSWMTGTTSVSTGSVATGLAAGVYSVFIGSNTPSCGATAVTTTIIAQPPSPYFFLKPYCSGVAYLIPPPGTNHQWYAGTTAISSSLGGTAPSLTVTSPSSGMIIRLRYLSSQGCQDSLIYTLFPTAPGTASVSYNKLVCKNATNGLAVISLTPVSGSLLGLSTFYINSTGSTTPAYSASAAPSAATQFTASNLVGGGTYSVKVFDGACNYGLNLTVPEFTLQATVTPASTVICSGQGVGASVNFTSPPAPGQYTCSWSPSTFLFSNSGQNNFITPTVAPGNTVSIVYSVQITPSLVNCPEIRTLTLTCLNLLTPTIAPIPTQCSYGGSFQINANPSGGSFSGPPALNTSGIFTPSLMIPGTYNYNYSMGLPGCTTSKTGSFEIFAVTLNLTGNTVICTGQSATLAATGVQSYSWGNGQNTSSVIVSPTTTSIYSLTGTEIIKGCSATKTISVVVTPYPVLSLTGNTIVCNGSPTTLTVSGAANYLWFNNTTSNVITFTPVGNASYSVEGSPSGFYCPTVKFITPTLIPLPVVSMFGDFLICKNKKGYLHAMGTDTYSWSTGSTGNFMAFVGNGPFQVKVIGTNTTTGCQNFAAVTITVTECNSLVEQQRSAISIYPNPSNGIFYVSAPVNPDISIYDYSGKTVFVKKMGLTSDYIDLSNLPDGIYFGIAVAGNLSQPFKLLIQR
jgi:hypothetical protein